MTPSVLSTRRFPELVTPDVDPYATISMVVVPIKPIKPIKPFTSEELAWTGRRLRRGVAALLASVAALAAIIYTTTWQQQKSDMEFLARAATADAPTVITQMLVWRR